MSTTPINTPRVDRPRAEQIVDLKPLSHLDALLTRRSPKLSDLQQPAPNDRELEILLTAASRVPDHGRLVPWRFVVIRGERRTVLSRVIRRRFDEVYPNASDERRKKMTGRMACAPLVIAVVCCRRDHPKIPEWEQVLTTGAVCMNLLHACRSTGYAGVWLTEWYAYDPVVSAELGLSGTERLAGFLHIGTSAATRDDRVRPLLSEVVSEY